jgi:hypothetical protein
MAILSGAILHDVNGFVVDRIQSGGPGNLNIPEEKIYELGNWNSVATVRDTPDLTFDLESFDMTCEFESLLLGKKGAAEAGEAAVGDQLSGVVGSNEVDFKSAVPIDVISPFKSRRNQFDIVKGLAIPYLTLERATYRFGVGQNATQQFSLRGDTIIYTQGQPYYAEFDIDDGPTFTLPSGAIPYVEGANTLYAYSVCLFDSVTGAYRRLFYDGTADEDGTGYWDTSSSFTIASNAAFAAYDTVRVVFARTTSTNYTDGGNNPNGNPVHESVSTKPAAIRARDIDVYVGTTRLSSVQSVEATWSVSLENDEELGNPRFVASEYDVPEVSGTVTVKPFDTADLWDKLSLITGVSSSFSIGPNSSVQVPLEIRVNHPDGYRLKTLYISDARFTPPGLQGQVNSKVEVSLPFSSDGGNLSVYNGERL